MPPPISRADSAKWFRQFTSKLVPGTAAELATLRHLIQRNPGPRYRDPVSGLTPIEKAIRAGCAHAVQELLAAGHGREPPSTVGRLSLISLALSLPSPHPPVIRCLLEAGHRPDSVGPQHGTALYRIQHHLTASALVICEVVELLLAAGVDPNEPSHVDPVTHAGVTPLASAASCRKMPAAHSWMPDVALALLRTGADPRRPCYLSLPLPGQKPTSVLAYIRNLEASLLQTAIFASAARWDAREEWARLQAETTTATRATLPRVRL